MDDPTESEQVGVVIPAAGVGRRLGGKRKQFRLLGEQPVLVQTLRRFAAHSAVDQVVVATGSKDVSLVEEQLKAAGLDRRCKVTAGGASRQESVALGLKAAAPHLRFLLVHDAVRPFITQKNISDVVKAVRESGAAALAVPVTDTVRRAQNKWFGKTVDRNGLYRMQTPQGFRRDWLTQAHARAAEKKVTATDDVALVRQQGHPVRVVPGSERNIKITTTADWELAQLLWAHFHAKS